MTLVHRHTIQQGNGIISPFSGIQTVGIGVESPGLALPQKI